jgi:hypothetical protein
MTTTATTRHLGYSLDQLLQEMLDQHDRPGVTTIKLRADASSGERADLVLINHNPARPAGRLTMGNVTLRFEREMQTIGSSGVASYESSYEVLCEQRALDPASIPVDKMVVINKNVHTILEAVNPENTGFLTQQWVELQETGELNVPLDLPPAS